MYNRFNRTIDSFSLFASVVFSSERNSLENLLRRLVDTIAMQNG